MHRNSDANLPAETTSHYPQTCALALSTAPLIRVKAVAESGGPFSLTSWRLSVIVPAWRVHRPFVA